MDGKKDIKVLLKNIAPKLNAGAYVFVSVKSFKGINREETICEFKEDEGFTIVIEKNKADELHLKYIYAFSWITLKVHSSLNAVGLTAAFSRALADNNISCNVIAGYYHDHIFVNKKDDKKAIQVLTNLSKTV